MHPIRELKEEDMDEAIEVISTSIHECVTSSDEDHKSIMGHIRNDMDWWRNNQDKCISLVYEQKGKLAGLIQIIECKNMRHLFVLPEFQGRGIASSLMDRHWRNAEIW
jgi:GNAT superfamily N-acetyltransferase